MILHELQYKREEKNDRKARLWDNHTKCCG